MIRRILFGITGILSTILSIVCYQMVPGFSESAKTYGGDAYTGIQNAASQTACNVRWLAEIVRFGLGSILLIAGIILIILAITSKMNDFSGQYSKKYFENKETEACE